MKMVLRRKSLQVMSVSILAAVLSSGIVNAQAPVPKTPVAVTPAPKPLPPVPPPGYVPDARGVKAELRGMMTQYPPSLFRVFQLDPTLLTNSTYLEPYPALASYFSQHPEIAHNPSYFLGSPEEYQYQPTFGDSVARAVEPLSVASVFIVLIVIIGWIIRGIMNHRRWLRVTKQQADIQNKLLERFSSNEETLTFIQTPAGKKLLESASVPQEVGPRMINAPIGRILWSIQLGIITLVAGFGLELVSRGVENDDAVKGFVVAGVLVISLGVGFILSAIGSYILSRRLGLLEQSPTSPS